jgi:hypothetical protein
MSELNQTLRNVVHAASEASQASGVGVSLQLTFPPSFPALTAALPLHELRDVHTKAQNSSASSPNKPAFPPLPSRSAAQGKEVPRLDDDRKHGEPPAERSGFAASELDQATAQQTINEDGINMDEDHNGGINKDGINEDGKESKVSFAGEAEVQKLGAIDPLAYCRSAMIGDISGACCEKRYGLLPTEHKLIERAFIKHITDQFRAMSTESVLAVTETKKGLLLRKDKLSPRAKRFLNNAARNKYTALVTVWEGRGRPEVIAKFSYQEDGDDQNLSEIHAKLETFDDPSLSNGTWQRIYFPKDHASNLRYRWTKVDIVNRKQSYEEDGLKNRLDWYHSWLTRHTTFDEHYM